MLELVGRLIRRKTPAVDQYYLRYTYTRTEVDQVPKIVPYRNLSRGSWLACTIYRVQVTTVSLLNSLTADIALGRRARERLGRYNDDIIRRCNAFVEVSPGMEWVYVVQNIALQLGVIHLHPWLDE